MLFVALDSLYRYLGAYADGIASLSPGICYRVSLCVTNSARYFRVSSSAAKTDVCRLFSRNQKRSTEPESIL